MHRKLDGSEFSAMVSLRGFSVGDQKYVFAIGRDISQLMTIQKGLESANLAKDRLFSIFSHDQRNHFNQMTSLFSIIDKDGSQISEHEILDLLSNMKRSSEQNATLLENLLDWYKSNTGQLVFSFTLPIFVAS